ncbi:MAG: hydantoinase B/oxoprolinase family protein [Firmicutes bacterium]|nr:hydantoinase B/oxoprolinase family protein [Bacillota bacterium]
MTRAIMDGRTHCYVPSDTLTISPRLRFHRDAIPLGEINPIDFEVIRYQLWSINEEHGETIAKISGSPITKYTMDFNPSILTEDGEIIYYGPYVQWFSGMSDVVVKWILENRSDNPGIEDGDMFLSNDPWVGTTHQQDVGLFCPVFVDGALFAWVTNAVHQYDVGGISAGSFVPQAHSVFDEATPHPPIKIVDQNGIRADVEELYLRHSRLPNLVRLDLHAAIAGNEAAKRRLLQLVDRYGAAKVKGVMRKILYNGEQAFLEKLRQIPDGTWRERAYLDVAREGDRGLYRIQLNLTKQGDELIFDNEGTDPQIGVLNASFAAWRGGILTVLNAFMTYDQLWSIGGASRHVKFRPTPGLLSCADYPASMSCGGTIGAYGAIILANNCIAKMMASSGVENLKRDIMANEANSMWPITQLSGFDREGQPFGSAILDPMIGGLGAFTFRDGIDTGGMYLVPKGRAANVEQNELHFPVLYLYRKELSDSGGAGKFRGGNGGELAFVPHKTNRIIQDTATSGQAVPTGLGLFGGNPACTNEYYMIFESDVWERFRSQTIPTDWRELNGRVERLSPKRANIQQSMSDVYVLHWSAGAGYGDPLLRDPEMVGRDIQNGAISQDAAWRLYGVVWDPELQSVDLEATKVRRRTIRQERIGRPDLRETGYDSADQHWTVIHDMLAVDRDQNAWVCAGCGAALGALTKPYKEFTKSIMHGVQDSNLLIGDPNDFVDVLVSWVEYCCPSCGGRIETELLRADDEPLWDIELR